MTINLDELGQSLKLLVATDLSLYPFVAEETQIIPYSLAKTKGVLPVEEKNGVVFLAITDPYDLEAIEEVRNYIRKQIREILVPKDVLEQALEKCYHQKEDAASELIATLSPDQPYCEKEAA